MALEKILPSGIIVPFMPFLTPYQKYDLNSVGSRMDYYVQAGVGGIFVLTTCGQSPNFSLEENKQLATEVIRTVNGRIPVYVGIGRAKVETDYPKIMLEHAIRQSAQAAVLMCPEMNPQEQLTQFNELAQARFPLIAYSLGNQQKQLVRVEDILALDEVIGAKVTIDTRNQKNEEFFKRVIATGKPVYIGEDVVLYGGLEMGARGGVNAIANLIPKQLVNLCTTYHAEKHDDARELQDKINNQLLSTIYYGKDSRDADIDAAAALQNALAQVFGGSSVMRSPKPTYGEEDEKIIHRALERFGISTRQL